MSLRLRCLKFNRLSFLDATQTLKHLERNMHLPCVNGKVTNIPGPHNLDLDTHFL